MKIPSEECRARAESLAVARLATTSASRQPHLVPVTFAFVGEAVVIGIDQKPKTTLNLRRLRNIAENPLVSLLWDHSADDWAELWWVRGDGTATVVVEGGPWSAAVESLTAKYPQYGVDPPRGPVIAVTGVSWSGWASS
jgi:PPOX class probable F420-dependent enzyme